MTDYANSSDKNFCVTFEVSGVCPCSRKCTLGPVPQDNGSNALMTSDPPSKKRNSDAKTMEYISPSVSSVARVTMNDQVMRNCH